MELDKIYYKYKGTNGFGVAEMLKGQITFTNPSEFNDPFDCDFELIDHVSGKGISNKDMFRVLSVTPIMDNILMWSYYGNNHNGICLGHTLSDYLGSLEDCYNGLVIYGDIIYSEKRPRYRYYKSYFDSIPFIGFLSKVKDCCFTKFYKWEHEKEFRILTFFDDFIEKYDPIDVAKNFVNIQGNVAEIYLGVNYNGKYKISHRYKKLTKDLVIYKLN